MPAFILLVAIVLIVLWYIFTSLFGKQAYKTVDKMYKDLTKEEPEENSGAKMKGEKEKL